MVFFLPLYSFKVNLSSLIVQGYYLSNLSHLNKKECFKSTRFCYKYMMFHFNLIKEMVLRGYRIYTHAAEGTI